MSARIFGGLASVPCGYRYRQPLLIHKFYFCDICHNLRIFFKKTTVPIIGMSSEQAADRERSNIIEAGLSFSSAAKT
jgi:hypothetical protein